MKKSAIKAKIFLTVISLSIVSCKSFPLFPNVKPHMIVKNKQECFRYEMKDRKQVLFKDPVILSNADCLNSLYGKNEAYISMSLEDFESILIEYRAARKKYEEK